MLEGRECYPTTLDSAFIIMLRRKADKVQGLDQDGVAFTTAMAKCTTTSSATTAIRGALCLSLPTDG